MNKLRVTLVTLVALATVAGIAAFSYQLALARVPQHRATLERLVRARTGLDVRFNELGVRWGWYGPEAVFRRVELGEPGEAAVLLRASELVVGFDAWRTMQTGQLEAGRITFVAPDIDLTRPSRKTQRSSFNARTDSGRAELLSRWPRGRVDIESGILRLPAPNSGNDSLAVQIKHASLRRVDEVWSATAQVFLPERLGRTARVSLRLTGNAEDTSSLEGTMGLEGRRLAFNGWRDLLQDRWRIAQFIPSSGGGDVAIQLAVKQGKVLSGQGEVHADDLSFRRPALEVASPAESLDTADALPSQRAGRVLRLGYLRGNWQLVRRPRDWRLTVEELAVGPRGRDMPRTTLTLDTNEERVQAKMSRVPVDLLASATQWFAPDLDLSHAQLKGTARDITFGWTKRNELGHRLRVVAKLDDLAIGSLAGMKARLTGDESSLVADFDRSEAQLESSPEVENLSLEGRLQLTHTDSGWRLSTDQFTAEHEKGKLRFNGIWHMAPASLDMQATLDEVDVPLLKNLLGEQIGTVLGATASRVERGRIEHADLEFAGDLSEAPLQSARRFRGSLTLRDGALAGDDTWPAVKGFDAQLDWNGRDMKARVDRGTGGPFEIGSLTAEWSVDGRQPSRIAAQGRGRLESVIEWLHANPHLQQYAPNASNLSASGAAVFNFTASIPGVHQARKTTPRVRVSASLDGAIVQLVPQFPRVEAVRGTLAFDSGRLQRSTLTASWLGGPATLRFAERQENGTSGLMVHAQGTLDAEQLLAASHFAPATRVSGRAPWKAEFSFMPEANAWRARVDSTLIGMTSELPAPLQKQADEPSPLHVDLEGNDQQAEARIALGDNIRSVFELNAGTQGNWQLARGVLQFGGEPAELTQLDGVSLQGHIDRFDLPAWLAASKQLAPNAETLHADLSVGEMLVAGRSYSNVAIDARHDAGGLTLELDSEALAGSVQWPSGEPAEARFARLNIPEGSGPPEAGVMLAALGSTMSFEADEFAWHGRPLGSLTAKLHATEGGVAVESIRLNSPSHVATGTLTCRFVSAPCRMEFELESHDAAATLREFGFRDELTAANATLRGELQWPLLAQRPWFEAVEGQVSLALADGTTRSADETAGRSFPLFAVPVLLRQSAVQSAQQGVASMAAAAVGSAPQLKFSALEADFEVSNGSARTANLHFDGDAEILMRGRTGFIDRDYDYTAWVLKGEDRLPAAVRRFGASPRVAAAWMALRDLISGPNTARSRALVHLGGTWDAPTIGPVQAPPEDAEQ
jgi:uncharacterized protein YhdP